MSSRYTVSQDPNGTWRVDDAEAPFFTVHDDGSETRSTWVSKGNTHAQALKELALLERRAVQRGHDQHTDREPDCLSCTAEAGR